MVCRLTLIVQLEDTHASLQSRAVVDRESVSGTADHLTFNKQCMVGQDQQRTVFINTCDRQLFSIWKVHALHLETNTLKKCMFNTSCRKTWIHTVLMFRLHSIRKYLVIWSKTELPSSLSQSEETVFSNTSSEGVHQDRQQSHSKRKRNV